MANTLTNLIPDAYSALDVVSRELVGMIPAVTLDPDASRAAVGQTVRSFAAPSSSATDITPGVTAPNDGDQTIANSSITITKSRRVPFRWNGEEERGLNNGGPGVSNIRSDQIAQAMRTLTNEMEADLTFLSRNASRSYGDPAGVPFGTAGDYTDASFARKIIVDNGGPQSGLQMVINTGAGANIRGKQADSNRQGTDSLLRQGVLLDTSGMMIRESAQIFNRTAGSGAGATTSGTALSEGTLIIPLASAGTGGINTGDSITFAGDPNQYVVKVGDSDVSNGGNLTIANPGLLQAIPASATAITVVGSGFRNMVFARSAIVLATRSPALPEDGDSAVDRTLITDPVSGITFELAMYAQYRQMQYELSAAWGVSAIKPEHMALLLG